MSSCWGAVGGQWAVDGGGRQATFVCVMCVTCVACVLCVLCTVCTVCNVHAVCVVCVATQLTATNMQTQPRSWSLSRDTTSTSKARSSKFTPWKRVACTKVMR